MSRQISLLVVACCLVVAARQVRGQSDKAPSANRQPPATDRFGDPLPAGAELRLGTIRLRHAQNVTGVTFSLDGKYLVSTAAWEDSIRFWDVASGRLVRRLRTTDGSGAYAVAFSPDGTKLASVGDNGFVQLWNLDSGKVLFEVLGHRERGYGTRVYGVAFSPDGAAFATAGADETVRVWDVATGRELLQLEGAEGGGDAHPVVYSPDGTLLASGTRQGTIYLWDVNEGKPARIIEKAHQRDVVSLLFTSDGQQLISSGHRFERVDDGADRNVSEIHVWDVSSGERQHEFKADEQLAGDSSLALSIDQTLLASTHHDRVVIWDVPSRRPIRTIKGDGRQYGGRSHGLAISPDKRLLATGAFDHKVHVWNVETGEPAFPQHDSHSNSILAIDYSPDGTTIATGSADGTVRLWSAASGEFLRTITKGTGWARYVEFLPGGKLLAIGAETRTDGTPGFGGEIKICRVADGEIVQHFTTSDRGMCGASSADGGLVALATGLGSMGAFGLDEPSECKIHVWDVESGEKLPELSGHLEQILALGFEPVGEALWSASDDQTLLKWDARAGKEIVADGTVLGSESERRHHRVAISPSTSRLVVGTLEPVAERKSHGKLIMRTFEAIEPLWEKTWVDSWPWTVVMSRDGKLLAAYLQPTSQSQAAKRIVVWSAESGEEQLSFEIDDDTPRSLAFSPDGTHLVSGMNRGDALIWDISAGKATGAIR